MLNDLCRPGDGNRWIEGKKRTSGPLHCYHCSQEVNATFGEQDHHLVSPELFEAKPISDGGGAACEIKIAKPHPPGRHSYGIWCTLDLPTKSFGEIAQSAGEACRPMIPVQQDLSALALRQQ